MLLKILLRPTAYFSEYYNFKEYHVFIIFITENIRKYYNVLVYFNLTVTKILIRKNY